MKVIGFCILFLISNFLISQSNENTKALSSDEKENLITKVNELFYRKTSIAYSIQDKLLQSSYADISEGKEYNKEYFDTLKRYLKDDNSNPALLYNVAEFYNYTNKSDLAESYYQKAFESLDIKLFNNDSASFYSLRGILKNKLEINDAFNDFERALTINPNDSIAASVYPLLLLSQGQYDELRAFCIRGIGSESENLTYWYPFLVKSEIAGSMIKFVNIDEETKKTFRKKDYDKIYDFSLIDKYANLNHDNIVITNCRTMADIFALFAKIMLFETSDEGYKFNYNAYEIGKLENIKKFLFNASAQKTLNEYSINFNYGFVHFMLEDWDKSIEYFNKAIGTFPSAKMDKEFNPMVCYDIIAAIYLKISDTVSYTKTIIKKIEKTNNGNSADDLMLLAVDYFLNGHLEKAEEYCRKAKALNSYNFEALRLLAHINFIKGSFFLAQFYFEDALKNVRNAHENYNILMQLAIYQIYHGDTENAYSNIEQAKRINGKSKCQLCENLIQDYIPKRYKTN